MLVAALTALPAFAQGASPSTGIEAYVRARAADADGAAGIAAAGYAAALADAPGDTIVALRAYRQALAVGDMDLASRAATVLVRAGVAPPDAAILDFAVAVRAGNDDAARAALTRMNDGPLDFIAPVLGAWLAFDRGEDPVALLDATRGTALGRRYAAQHRALLLIASRRSAEGLMALQPLLGTGMEGEDLRIDAALLLAATGEKRDAKALLAGAPPELAVLRNRLNRAPHAGAAAGSARLFLTLAVDLAGEDTLSLSILLTRAALLLDPADDRARLYLSEALSRSGAHREALAVLAEVPLDSPFARAAAAGAVAALQRAGRVTEALERSKKLASGRDSTSADAQSYGDLLAQTDQFDAAAAAYGLALARAGAASGWSLHFLHGSALDRAGRWDEALPALRRAVALGPDEAAPLAYLGSALVERGETLDEAQALLERASKLSPDDAAVADSLAWAYYRRGDVARALPLLERATQSDPAASRANEHLGDAYWRLGRRYEARYAWQAAAINAEDPAALRLAGKLANGLSAPQAN